MWGQLRIIQGGHLKIRGTGENSNMRGHTKCFGGLKKNRRDKAFRGPVTEGCLACLVLELVTLSMAQRAKKK